MENTLAEKKYQQAMNTIMSLTDALYTRTAELEISNAENARLQSEIKKLKEQADGK